MMHPNDLHHIADYAISNEIGRIEHAQDAVPVAVRASPSRKILEKPGPESDRDQYAQRPFWIGFCSQPIIDTSQIVQRRRRPVYLHRD